MRRWFVLLLLCVFVFPVVAQDDDNENPIPDAMPMVDEGDADIINILLMGSATNNGEYNPGLTDVLMLVSVNRDTERVAVLSIPRDYYAYIPNFNMRKINQAYFYAEMNDLDGIDVMRQTIEYNFGIEIDYYARVDFNSFGAVIDSVGGIDVAVDCAIEDWMLISPELDKQDADNWEMHTLWAGMNQLDGATALWYVRSRRTSSDLDRGRRQQDVLRALWRQIRNEGLLENFSDLWQQFNEIVETDIPLSEAVSFLPMMANLEPASVEFYAMERNTHMVSGYTPEEGRFVWYPQREAMIDLMQQFVNSSGTRRLTSSLPTVAVYNGSGIDGMAFVAAQRLEREGFRTTVMFDYTQPRNYNHVIDHTGLERRNPVGVIQDVLSITDEGVGIEPDPNRDFDYVVYVGNEYQYFACTYPVDQPVYAPDEESETASSD
ncbi:MAG: LCP family protein [Anaerolineae bacterium]|nr:LCP family protein [Anaerolineae bacterium]MDQ7034988.1 LCP family protein [Anaerolineae bacterium]